MCLRLRRNDSRELVLMQMIRNMKVDLEENNARVLCSPFDMSNGIQLKAPLTYVTRDSATMMRHVSDFPKIHYVCRI